jgi:ribonucleoside-diphosphate reductase alpha chain
MQTRKGNPARNAVTARPRLSANALTVLQARYLRRDPTSGQVAEAPGELFRRVARSVARAEARSGDGAAAAEWEEQFFEAMARLDLLPNSPCLMNAGTPLGQLSACFVLPVEDSMEGIFDSLRLMALIQQSGGGVGFSFSRLRPRGDPEFIALVWIGALAAGFLGAPTGGTGDQHRRPRGRRPGGPQGWPGG